MAITVGDIYTKFPSFKQEDMVSLVGSKEFDGRTTINLSRLASYHGGYAKDLSIFVAGKEKEDYTRLLADGQRQKINNQLGIKDDKDNGQAKNNALPSSIPKDVSVFDIQKQNKPMIT